MISPLEAAAIACFVVLFVSVRLFALWRRAQTERIVAELERERDAILRETDHLKKLVAYRTGKEPPEESLWH